MRPAIVAAMAAALFLNAAPAMAAEAPAWTVDMSQSRIVFVGRQMRVPTEGRFATFTATVRFDPSDLAASAADIVIDTASATSGNPMIDRELRKETWFAVARFPEARFTTASFRETGKGLFEAAAKLTLRGVARDVVLPFGLRIGDDPADPAHLLAHAEGEMTIGRLAYGIGQGEWADTSIVADEVTIRIVLVARRVK